MGLLSYFKRPPDAAPAASAPPLAEPDAVAAARARARRRLVGATVLLGVGVIGFPLLFETQPRPIPVDIPIEIPGKDGDLPGVRPPAVSMARASAAVVDDGPAQPLVVPGQSGAADRAAAAPVEIVERGAEQGRDGTPGGKGGARPAASASASASASAGPAASRPPSAPASKPAAPASVNRPTPAPALPLAPPADDGARARALLDGQSVPRSAASAAAAQASAAASRVVVQVGAYTDPAKLAEARRKLESLGYKTYTQVLESEAGTRTRVRIGPFPTRAEADKAAARVKAAGLPVAILAL